MTLQLIVSLSLKRFFFVFFFKINKLDKAVAAAHTFFQANPDHVEMRQNLDYYKMMAGVEEGHFKDLEAREHMVIRIRCHRWSREERLCPVDPFQGHLIT